MNNSDNTENKSWVPAAVGTAAVLGGGALGLRHLGKGSIRKGGKVVADKAKESWDTLRNASKTASYEKGATAALCKLGILNINY